MGYRVLYREWRPQNFQNLVGQNHIRQTLQNAIKKERIAHAYLFAGPRGTGKTSTAKILAKAVNCLSPLAGEPCNSCHNCEGINTGRSLDVVEIDAASNRGIDEIRELRERIGFVPSQGRYKVYIIDEVHMLTTEAFNALLKTLEEPPGHVIFVLATTEPQRIPATILSRCQRFDFRKIPPVEMEERLREILNAYGLTVEEGVLSLIVRKAEGGLRDAISILDQCISFSEDNISLQTAYEVLGMVKSDALFSLLEALIEKNAAKLLVQTNNMLQEGLEPGQIIKDLLEVLRGMILLLVCGPDSSLVLASDKEREIMLKQGRELGLEWLSKTVSRLARIDNESRWRQNMRIVLETTLVGLLLAEEEVKEVKTTPPRQASKLPEKGRQAVKQGANAPEKQQGVTLGLVKEKWPELMEAIKERKKTVHAFLTVSEPREINDDQLILVFKEGYTFHKEQIEGLENKLLVEEALEQVMGKKLKVICRQENLDSQLQENPIQKARDLFGPDVVIIKD